MQFQILPSSKIDFNKWDNCIEKAPNGLIYATSSYLNTMTDNWSALIINDYKSIMPLPWRRKWGINYLYTPPFTQQLGLIGENNIVEEELIKTINLFSTYGDYLLNFNNSFNDKKQLITSKINYILPLSNPYTTIKEAYSKQLKSFLQKANSSCLYYQTASISIAIDAYQSTYWERMPHLTQNDFNNFKVLCISVEKECKAFARQVTNNNNELLAIALFLNDSKRIYNLMPTTLNNGREALAMHFLLDKLFEEHAERNLLFDFEGSDLAGVKRFYEQFGSTNQPYLHWHFNNLPWPISLFKK